MLNENFVTLLQNKELFDTLPPLWQIIIYEGIREHHILFTNLKKEIPISGANISDLIENSEFLEKIILQVLKCASLSEISNLFSELDSKQLQIVYGAYLYILNRWKEFLKVNSH